MDQYNLNSSDAAILASYMRSICLGFRSGSAVIVAADQRLLRAAAAEGLATLIQNGSIRLRFVPFSLRADHPLSTRGS